MLCKDCRSEMKKRPLDGVLVDACPDCEGCWLDGGELDALVAGPGKSAGELLATARAELDREHGATTTGSMCPRCQKDKLGRMVLHGVTLDRCPKCKGLWFDAGELDKVKKAEKSRSWVARMVGKLFGG